VRLTEIGGLSLARQLLQAQEYWRVKGLRADVVILNEHPVEYLDEVQNLLTSLVEEPRWAGWKDRPGGMYLLRSDGMPDAERILLSAVARVVVRGDMGELSPQLDRPTPWLDPSRVALTRAVHDPEPASVSAPVPPLVMENRYGGFTPDGREYIVVLDGDRETPLPWSNVLANPTFGTIVSASGSAFTWAENSRENRLTPFANDPTSDPTSEAIFLRDEESGAVWGATPGPLPRSSAAGRWVIRHGAGVTRYQHSTAGLDQELALFVPPEDPVKIAVLTLANTSGRPRRFTAYGYVEWTLGPPRARERRFVVTDVDASGALTARNAYNTDFAGRVAFWRASETAASYTCDRTDFVGRNRTLANPAALLREQLAGRVGAGLDPCAALQIPVVLEAGETRRIAFVLGQGLDAAHAAQLIGRYATVAAADAALGRTERNWDDILGAIQVKTPDDSFDLIVNRWLLYQTLASRVWARSGPSQPGGAFGFRDQLQDVLALVHTRPDITRAHLLRAA
jgi:cyclic beta-1,2-glucan synthetase